MDSKGITQTMRGKEVLIVGDYMYQNNKVIKHSSGENGYTGETSYWACRHRSCPARLIIVTQIDGSEEIRTTKLHTCDSSAIDILHHKARQVSVSVLHETKCAATLHRVDC